MDKVNLDKALVDYYENKIREAVAAERARCVAWVKWCVQDGPQRHATIEAIQNGQEVPK